MKLTVTAAALAFAAVASISAQGVTDAQIASIVVTANQVDIDAGKLAIAQGTNAEVKSFGQQMVDAHTGDVEASGQPAHDRRPLDEPDATPGARRVPGRGQPRRTASQHDGVVRAEQRRRVRRPTRIRR